MAGRRAENSPLSRRPLSDRAGDVDEALEYDRELLLGYASDPIATMEHFKQSGIAKLPLPVVESVEKLRDFSIENKK